MTSPRVPSFSQHGILLDYGFLGNICPSSFLLPSLHLGKALRVVICCVRGKDAIVNPFLLGPHNDLAFHSVQTM